MGTAEEMKRGKRQKPDSGKQTEGWVAYSDTPFSDKGESESRIFDEDARLFGIF